MSSAWETTQLDPPHRNPPHRNPPPAFHRRDSISCCRIIRAASTSLEQGRAQPGTRTHTHTRTRSLFPLVCEDLWVQVLSCFDSLFSCRGNFKAEPDKRPAAPLRLSSRVQTRPLPAPPAGQLGPEGGAPLAVPHLCGSQWERGGAGSALALTHDL